MSHTNPSKTTFISHWNVAETFHNPKNITRSPECVMNAIFFCNVYPLQPANIHFNLTSLSCLSLLLCYISAWRVKDWQGVSVQTALPTTDFLGHLLCFPHHIHTMSVPSSVGSFNGKSVSIPLCLISKDALCLELYTSPLLPHGDTPFTLCLHNCCRFMGAYKRSVAAHVCDDIVSTSAYVYQLLRLLDRRNIGCILENSLGRKHCMQESGRAQKQSVCQ